MGHVNNTEPHCTQALIILFWIVQNTKECSRQQTIFCYRVCVCFFLLFSCCTRETRSVHPIMYAGIARIEREKCNSTALWIKTEWKPSYGTVKTMSFSLCHTIRLAHSVYHRFQSISTVVSSGRANAWRYIVCYGRNGAELELSARTSRKHFSLYVGCVFVCRGVCVS